MATIFGTAGNDTINGSFSTATTAGPDTIYGLGGDDFIVRSGGNDTIDGGAGFDTLDYSSSSNRVVVNALFGTVRELSALALVKFDLINSIEEFRTGSGDDVITGSGADENFRPGLGRDTIQGGSGSDTVLYTDATTRVFVDLVRGFAIDHGGSRDGLDSIESARGGTGNDVFRGGTDFGLFRGGLGNDTFISGWNGTSSFSNNIGIDYNERTSLAPVVVDLAAGTATLGAETDTLIGIFAQVRGGAGADTILGNEANNIFRPRGGADYMDGRGGYDRADYRDEAGGITGSINAAGNGTVLGSDGQTDTLVSMEWIRGSTFNDTLSAVGNLAIAFGAYEFATSDQPTLEGWIGDDTLSGTAGTQVVVRYTADQGSVTVNLASGFAIDHWGNRDTLSNIWGVRASAFDDILTLGAGNEWVLPGDGADIVDGGAGIDRISFDGAPAGAVVDLALGTAQDGWGNIDTITGFEAITGTAFADQLFGDANANWFTGGGGNDLIDGRGGSDTVVYFYNSASTGGVYVNLAAGTATGNFTGTGTGSIGTDTLVSIENVIGSAFSDALVGGFGDNALYGWLGDDSLSGGQGNDLLDGGDGIDTADYSQNASRVVIDLNLGMQNTQGAGLDTLVSIENVLGTAQNDTLTGNGADNGLYGGDGNDIIFGGGGDDYIDGGDGGQDILQGNAGIDTVAYGFAQAAVTVSLALQGAYQATGGGGLDYLAGFENLTGSSFNDTLTGNAQANVLDGGQGDDVLNGGDGDDTLLSGFVVAIPGFPPFTDNDTLAGGNGTDTASYEALDPRAFAPGIALGSQGVSVSLLLQGAAQYTGRGGFDTLSSIENLTGSQLDDSLTGDAGNNILKGLGGDDILEGGLGTDILDGGDGIDLASYAGASGAVTVYLNASSATGSAGTDYFTSIEGFIGSAFADTLVGNTLANVLKGGGGNDRLYGLAGDDVLNGGAGNDQFYGDTGNDTADYSDATLTVRAVLGTGGNVDTINYGLDFFSSIENLTGGAARDFLTGDGNANVLTGNGGNDVLVGGGGNDTLLGGDGDDDSTGGLGADRIVLGAGNDIIRFTTAADSRAASMDTIQGFVQSGTGFDRIGLENNAGALFAAITPTSIALGTRQVIEAASTMDDLLAQIAGLAASTASTLSVTQVDVNFGGAAGRYVVVNDTIAAFDAATDMLVRIEMDAASTGNLTAGNFFLF